MKKILTLLAVVATVGFVSCKKELADATITASDVTVEEGSTVKVQASTNSSAPITFVADNSGVYSVSSDGVVTGIKEGSGNLTLKVAEVADAFKAAERTIKVTVTKKEVPQQPAVYLTMDGDFSDWAALPAKSFSQTYGDEDASHPALTHCKVYANSEYIYVYVEWDTDYITDKSWVPFHCYINTDGNATTGGFSDQFADACSDILLEGAVYADDAICSYWAGGYAWIGEANGSGWGWAPDTDNLFPEDAPTVGAGIDGKYEFSISRSMMAAVGFPIADVFSIGFDIQQNWNSVGVLPNASASESNPSGTAPSLTVTTQK